MPEHLSQRHTRLAAELPLNDAILLVAAGEPIPLPEGSDQTYPFRAHAEYFYLTGQEVPGGVVAFDPRDGHWHSFVPAVAEGEQVWEGRSQPAGELMAGFSPWITSRRERPVVNLGAPLSGIMADKSLTQTVRNTFTHLRRTKDADEVKVLRGAIAATANGFAALPDLIRAGTTERQVQIQLEAAFFRAGGSRTGYGTIVGSGPNAAVLHFAPSPRVIQDGEFVLVDAGAEIDRYTADVTRTFVAGRPTPFQRDLYAAVLEAEQRAINRCVVGAEWKQIHLAAAVDLVAALVDMGVMRGNPASLVEREAHTLFFPHGIGHMVGLGVRDAGGLAPGRTKDSRSSLRTLRMDLPLAAGYVVTVEPGIYFIPQLLNDSSRRERFRDAVDWTVVDKLLGLGGVRIEDNVLITAGAPETLTAAISKEIS